MKAHSLAKIYLLLRANGAVSLRGHNAIFDVAHVQEEHAIPEVFTPEGDIPRVDMNDELEEKEEEDDELCESIVAIAGTPDPFYFSHDGEAEGYRHLKSRGVDFRNNERNSEAFGEEEEFACVLSSNGDYVPLQGEQMGELREYLNTGEFISGETTVEGLVLSETALFEDGSGTGTTVQEVNLPSGPIVLKPGKAARRRMESSSGRDKRRLASYQGVKEVLAVRVCDSRGLCPDDAFTISDKIFGTTGDTENMRTQFLACSFGEFEVTNQYSKDISRHLAAPGVIEVNINVKLETSSKSTIRNEVTKAVQAKLGFNLPSNFDHVIYILEKCYVECGWAAYAYINSWNSVFQGNYYKMVGVQVHEIGHNLNLAHSGGIDSKTYSDHTCMMGNPLYSDNVGEMCFNPAKNFQIAYGSNSWYAGSAITWTPGKTTPKYWKGKVVGIADYDNNPEGHPVTIRIETSTNTDYFLGFNRAYRANKDNKDGDDQVTIIESGQNGLGYSQSYLKAMLSQGGTHTFSNWLSSGRDLVITVNEINISAGTNPGYADVTMNFNNAVIPSATNAPTNAPTKSSGFPAPTKAPTPFPTFGPTSKPTSCLKKGVVCPADPSLCCKGECRKGKCR
mmetsp:Transcript_14209/g.27659  ORF Transcript_14209/g.27659 Transcript_14209/m.27659 type:complete len:620 (+) Transcript_14209:701-2560(+)